MCYYCFIIIASLLKTLLVINWLKFSLTNYNFAKLKSIKVMQLKNWHVRNCNPYKMDVFTSLGNIFKKIFVFKFFSPKHSSRLKCKLSVVIGPVCLLEKYDSIIFVHVGRKINGKTFVWLPVRARVILERMRFERRYCIHWDANVIHRLLQQKWRWRIVFR